MDQISRLGLDIETAGLARGAQAMDRFTRSADRAEREATQLERRQRAVNAQMTAMTGLARNLAFQLGAAFSVAAVVRAGDAWTSALNQIRLVTDSTRELRDVTNEVFALSQRTGSRFEAMTGMFASIQRAAGETIGSQREVLRMTETIAKLAAASGGPEGSRNAALFQLRQMLQGSVVQAQEFNSLIDGTPLLVQAIADSIGVTRGELRQMVLDQNLAVTQVIAALREQADEADALFARVDFTIGDALVRLQNAFQRLVGTNLGPVLSSVMNAISQIAYNLDALIPVISGVGVAFAVAFSPTAVMVLAGAVKGLFAVIAAHPIAALAGGLTAAALAMRSFGEEVVVARHSMADAVNDSIAGLGDIDQLPEGVRDQVRNTVRLMREELEDLPDTIDVTLRDVVDAVFLELRDAATDLANQARDAIAGFGSDSADEAAEASQVWTDLFEQIKAGGNFTIAVFKTMLDAARIAFPRIADLIAVAFVDGVNDALESLEQLLNAMRRLTDPLGLTPEIRLPRLDQPAEAMERLARAGQEFGAAMRENFSRDWIGDAMAQISARARDLALARTAAADQAQAEAEAADAAAAAAEAASQNASKIAEQMRARQAMFDELEAQLRLSEREFEIYQQTEELLSRFPDYYRSMAAGAEDVAAAARAAAEEDARSLDSLRQRVAALQSMRQLLSDRVRTESLIEAAQLGADELELRERTLDLLEEHAELYERLGDAAYDAARAEAERQLTAERTLKTLEEQARRARDIANAPWENLGAGLERVSDDFWDNFVDRGFGAFDDLGDQLKDVLRRLQADILRAVFDPIVAGIRNAITGAVQGVNFGAAGGAGGGGFGGMFGNILGTFGLGGANPAGLGSLSGIANIGLQLAGATGIGSGNLFGMLGMLNQGGQLATFAANGLNALGLVNSAAGLGNIINQVFSPANAIGGFVGSGLANMLGLVNKPTGGAVGGTVGGAIGAFIGGPLGSAIGSFIGSTIGGLIGPNPSGHQAWAEISASGQLGPLQGGKRNENTVNMLTATFEKAMQAVEFIEALGGTTSAYLSSLSISEKHQSVFELRDRQTGQIVARTSDADVAARNSVGDPNELYDAAISALLKTTTFENPVLNAVNSAMSNAGKGADEILEVMQKLAQVLPDTGEQLSQWGQALKTLEQTFDDLRASTEDVAGVAAELDQAFEQAMTALRDQFSDSIEDAILAIESPMTLQFEQLLETQAQRLADANAMGADVARVMHLNELELQAFIQSAGGSAEAFAGLNDIFSELIEKASAAGNATQPLIDAYNQARQGVVAAFDNQISQQLANLSNPTLGALQALLEAQKARLEQARAIGANIVAVERLNAAEQQAFFQALSDEQKQSLAAHLGLIEDFTGRIAVVLASLGDELNARIDDVDQMRSDLLRQSDDMRRLSENLAATRQQIVDRYGAATPMAGVDALRERFADLAEEARGGNDSALQALGQVGAQLIEASRALYGSTATFRGDYDLVTDILGEAEVLAQDRADQLQSQAETLLQQRDLLIEIRDLLAQPDPALDALQQRFDLLDENQDVVASLLSQYLALAAQSAGQQIDLGALYANAAASAQAPPLTPSTATYVQSPSASNSGAGPTTQAANNNAAGANTADSQTAQVVAVLIDAVQSGNDAVVESNDAVRREIRNLNERLGVGGATAR